MKDENQGESIDDNKTNSASNAEDAKNEGKTELIPKLTKYSKLLKPQVNTKTKIQTDTGYSLFKVCQTIAPQKFQYKKAEAENDEVAIFSGACGALIFPQQAQHKIQDQRAAGAGKLHA